MVIISPWQNAKDTVRPRIKTSFFELFSSWINHNMLFSTFSQLQVSIQLARMPPTGLPGLSGMPFLLFLTQRPKLLASGRFIVTEIFSNHIHWTKTRLLLLCQLPVKAELFQCFVSQNSTMSGKQQVPDGPFLYEYISKYASMIKLHVAIKLLGY